MYVPPSGPIRNDLTGTEEYLWYPAVGIDQWRGTRREQNDVLFASDCEPDRGMLIALADGIGTEASAGKAAYLAVNAMKEDFLQNAPMVEIQRQTLRMMGAAHSAVRSLNEDYQNNGMMLVGAAAACVLIRGKRMGFSSAGNVRIFLSRMGRLLQLNRDHLLSLEAEERDILSGEAPDLDPEWAKRVTAFVGMEGLQKVDSPSTPLMLVPGDRILIISSGLYGVLSEEELVYLTKGPQPQLAAEAIIQRVRTLHPSSQSNISCAVVRIGPS